jgi:hypothetical protein
MSWTYTRFYLLLSAWCLFGTVQAQITGGQSTYAFLRLPASARVVGLAGHVLTVVDDDVSLVWSNPAALNPLMHQQLAFQHGFIGGQMQHGAFNYGHSLGKQGTTLHAGVQYARYGEIEQTDEFFQTLGTFNAADYALTIGAAHPVYDRLNVGANLRLLSSQFGQYNSLGLATDFAATYRDTAKRTAFTLVFRNFGRQLSTYDPNLGREPLPFEVQVGFSKQLKYLPFRFSFIYTSLNRWNVLYDDPNLESGTIFLGEEPSEPSAFNLWLDNFFRHLVFNGELLIGARENFRLRFGYNYRLHRELTVQGYSSLAGFSFGVGMKVNRFRIDFGRGIYHLAGGQMQLGISTNFKEFRKN